MASSVPDHLRTPGLISNRPCYEGINIRWGRELWDAFEPFISKAVYVNNLLDEGQERVIAAYGEETYKKLTAIKKKYDPSNLFHLNQNIKPGA